MWIKKFKNALVLKDTDKLNELMESIPEYTVSEDIDSVLCLLKEATFLVQELKDDTESAMLQMQKNMNYLKSTQEKQTSKFDVNS